ncbi:MAG: TetR/AcrR family transcriptional regulator [Pseudomonas sp.]
MASSKRDQLVSTALELFYREGYHATGIDRILAESGVAKMTLYKHFKSKEELILAVLDSQHQQLSQRMQFALENLPPREAILGTYEGLHLWLNEKGFRGCLFSHAAAEFSNPEHPVHQQAALNKRFVCGFFLSALQRLGAPEPERLARQLQFLFEGAMSMGHLYGPTDQALVAKAAAEQLLEAAGV